MCFFYYADNLKVSTIVSIFFFVENSSNSWWKLALKLRISVRFVAIFYVERVAVLTMTWSYVRIAVIVYHFIVSLKHHFFIFCERKVFKVT